MKTSIEIEGKEKYCVEISERYVVSEDMDAKVEINSDWKIIRENTKILAIRSLGHAVA
jgi:hypothetical protein